MSDPVFTVNLSVVHVGSGGNTRKGVYFYSFDPDILVIRKPRTTINFVLDKDSTPDFVIVDLVSSDAKYQLSAPRLTPDSRSVSVVNENTQRQLIYVSILVHDTRRDELVACDPQVINSPEGN